MTNNGIALEEVQRGIASLVQNGNDSYVAIFIGATTGLGEYAATELAELFGRRQSERLHVVIVGRSLERGDTVVKTMQQQCNGGKFAFVQAQDLSLISDVDRVASAVKQRLQEWNCSHVDFLMQTQGKVDFDSRRKDTLEGLDKSMALLLYSRVRFVDQLSGLLCSGIRPAHVLSVYGAGLEGKIDINDLSVRKSYGFASARRAIVAMKTIRWEQLAGLYAGKIAFVHYFPGVVITPAFHDPTLPTWFKVAWTLAEPIVKVFFATKPKEAAQRMLYFATDAFPPQGQGKESRAIGTDGKTGSGAYSVQSKNSVTLPKKMAKYYDFLRKLGFEMAVKEHFDAVFSTIERGERFST